MHLVINFFLNLLLVCHVSSIVPSAEVVTAAGEDILALINEVQIVTTAGTEYPFVAGFTRLAFHDCIGDGGCDGCIDETEADNAGLSRYINALSPLYNENYTMDMSRADFYALAAVVALEKATENSVDKFLGRSQLKFGRSDCSSVTDEDSANTFPSAFGDIDATLSYFATEFAFTPRETVALLGAHTLGRAHVENSGFEGRWVRNTEIAGVNPASVLDNEYYKEILLPWRQVDITSNGVTKAQWQDPGTAPNNIISRLNPNQLPMLFNSDFCLSADFNVIDDIGHVNCIRCRRSSSTHTIVVEFANDNTQWLGEFTDIFMKMISRNGNTLVTVSRDSLQDQSRDDIVEYFSHLLENK